MPGRLSCELVEESHTAETNLCCAPWSSIASSFTLPHLWLCISGFLWSIPTASQVCGGARIAAWSLGPLKEGTGIKEPSVVKQSCFLFAQGFCSWLTAIFRIK